LERASVDALAAEADSLARRWRDLRYRATSLDAPARLEPIATFAAALASGMPGMPARIGVDDPGAFPDLRTAFPEAAVAHRPEADWPIDLDAAFEQALSETVALPGHGSIHFEAARAAVLIDVDTGTPEAGPPERIGLAVNLAAAAAIARHIRLRNLGGGIVVDFVGMDSRASRERLRSAFAEALAADPAAPQILGWTRLGHLELVRARRGRPLAEALLESSRGGAPVKTAVTVAHEALRALRREARAQPGRRWRALVAPEVAAVLTGTAAGAVLMSEQRFARNITIEAVQSCDRERFQISAM
jgi:ribonuclease G